jgi:hypothetical protein
MSQGREAAPENSVSGREEATAASGHGLTLRLRFEIAVLDRGMVRRQSRRYEAVGAVVIMNSRNLGLGGSRIRPALPVKFHA